MSFSASSAPIPQADDRRGRGRRIALLILALCAAPTVAAWLAYFVWPPQSRTNYGELIQPRLLSDPEMRRPGGGAFRLSELRGKWMLLQVDSAACPEGCRNKLVYMRQARLAQGREAERIERVWLVSDATDPAMDLLREHEGLRVAHAPAPLVSEFSPAAKAVEYIYLVDPRGNLMLRFPAHPDERRMLRDLARLLRASRIG